MKTFACAATRRELQAYHDEELPVADQIAVGVHLEECEPCAAALAELRMLQSLIRTSAREHADATDDRQSFQHSVVSRLKAEADESLVARVQDMFEDMRLVYAGLGASVAAIACVLMMLNMMRFVKEPHHPDSLAAIVSALASSASGPPEPLRSTPVVVDARLLLSPSPGGAIAADSDVDVEFFRANAEYALNGVVTREGRVDSLELVRTRGTEPVAPDEARAFRKLMGAVKRQRYEPAKVDGLPVAVNKVWLVAAYKVHGNTTPLDRPASPDAKKRVTSHRAAPRDPVTA